MSAKASEAWRGEARDPHSGKWTDGDVDAALAAARGRRETISQQIEARRRARHAGGSSPARPAKLKVAGPGRATKWAKEDRTSVDRAIADAEKREPELLAAPDGLHSLGYATNKDRERERLQFLMLKGHPLAVTSYIPGVGSRITINDTIPFRRITTGAPSSETPAGVVTHEIGHAFFDRHGYVKGTDIVRLMLKHDISFDDVAKVSDYGGSDPREALAELYGMAHTPGFQLPEPLRSRYQALEAEVRSK